MKNSLTNKSILLIAFVMLVANRMEAQMISREYFNTFPLMADVEIDVEDDEYASLSTTSSVGFRDKNPYAIVAVGFDPDMNLCYSEPKKFKITVEVEETIITTPGTIDATNTNQYTLIINYDPHLGIVESQSSFVKIPNARKVNITIVDVKEVAANGAETTVASPGSLPADVYVEGEIIRERYDDFDPTDPGSVPAFTNTLFGTYAPIYLDHNVHFIEWDNVPGAVEYEIEWTFVDRYWGTALSTEKPESLIVVNFTNNASSVRVRRKAANTFYIPAIYSKGHVVFRIRAIGRGGPDLEDDIFGPWSLADGNTIDAIAGNNKRYSESVSDNFLFNGFNNVNSQYAVQFAEEGKLMASGTYADGSLRVRQNTAAVKIDYAEDYGKMGVITETIYDHMGRAAVTTLPAVTKNGFWYTPNYNQNMDGDKYSYLDFDTDDHLADGCVTGADPMGTQSGSSQYYSPNNLFKAIGHQGLIADAEKFPFIQNAFERDNTNRPKLQSGVGATHRMGNGHETKYIYGGAEAIQLNRLFGTDAGYAEYYQKNMIIDANGQISITYTDMAGRTVATSLAGEVPSNVNALRDSSGTVLAENGDTVVDDLLVISVQHPNGSSNFRSPDGTSYTLTKTLLIDKEQDYIFSYSTELLDFQDSCFTFCLDCIYDLTLSLMDECGNYLIGNGDSTAALTMTLGGSTDTTCNHADSLSLADFVVHLMPGAYTVHKTLSVNLDSMEVYVEQMIQNSLCLLTPADFYEAPDTSGCFITCESCMDHIGTWPEFFTEEKIDSLFDGDSTLAHQTLWPIYLDMQASCEAICAPDVSRDFCRGIYSLMLMDMNPGGQYAQYSDVNGAVSADDYPVSILNPANILPHKQPNQFHALPSASVGIITNISGQMPTWRKPVHYDKDNLAEPFREGYYDEYGEREKLYIQKDANDDFVPAVVDPLLVVTVNESLNQYYTYHENLQNLSDFLDNRPANVSQSLVVYHPEFMQYYYCALLYSYTDTINNRTVNTFNFDAELANLNYSQASARFGSMTTLADLYDALEDEDPFFDYTLANVSYSLPFSFTSVDLLWGKFQNFQTLNSTVYDIAEAAYIQNTCGYTFPIGCSILSDIWGPSGYIHDDATWQTFVQYYASAKQEVILNSMIIYGIFGDSPSSPANWTKVVNNCIGNSDYFPYFDTEVSPGVPLLQNPCGFPQFIFYHQKQKRVGTTESQVSEDFGLSSPPTLEELGQYATQAYYNETGNCPMVGNLEYLLAKLVQQKQGGTDLPQLTAASVDLSAGGYMGSVLFDHIGGTSPITYVPSISGPVLTASMTGLACTPFELTLSTAAQTAGYDFDDIQTFFSVHDVSGGPSTYQFTVKAIFYDAGINPNLPETLDVHGTTCLPLTGCEGSFSGICKPTPVAKDLMNLMSFISQEDELFNTSGYTLSAPEYDHLITPRLQVYLGTGGTYVWTHSNVTTFGEFTLSNGGNEIVLTLSNAITDPSPDYYTFASIGSNTLTAPNNSAFSDFRLKAVQIDPTQYTPPFAYPPGNAYVNIEGNITVSGIGQTFPVTLCQEILPLECNTAEHHNLNEFRAGFELLLQGIPFSGFQDSCILSVNDPNPPYLLTDIVEIVSFEADMEMSQNSVNSEYYRIIVRLNDSSLDTLTGKYCMPLRNCVPCTTETSPCAPDEAFIRIGPLSQLEIGGEGNGSYTISPGSDCKEYTIIPAEFVFDHPNGYAYWSAWADSINAAGSGFTAEIADDYMYVRFILSPDGNKCRCEDDDYYALNNEHGHKVSDLLVTCCQTVVPPCSTEVLSVGPFPDGWFSGQNTFEQVYWDLTDSTLVYEEDSMLIFENRCQAVIRTGVMQWDTSAIYKVTCQFVPFETPDPVSSIQLPLFNSSGGWVEALSLNVTNSPQEAYFTPSQTYMMFGIDIQNVDWDSIGGTCNGSSKVGLKYLYIEKMGPNVGYIPNYQQNYGIDPSDISAPGATLADLLLTPLDNEDAASAGIESEGWIEGNGVHIAGACAAGYQYFMETCPGYTVQIETEVLVPDSNHAPTHLFLVVTDDEGFVNAAGPFPPGPIQHSFTPDENYASLIMVGVHSDSVPDFVSIFSGLGSFTEYCTDSVHFSFSELNIVQGCSMSISCDANPIGSRPCETVIFQQDAFYDHWYEMQGENGFQFAGTDSGSASAISEENGMIVIHNDCASTLSLEMDNMVPGSMYHFEIDISIPDPLNPPTIFLLQIGTSTSATEYGDFPLTTGHNDVYFTVTGSSAVLSFLSGTGYLEEGTIHCFGPSEVGIQGFSLSQMNNYSLVQNEVFDVGFDSTILAWATLADLGINQLVNDGGFTYSHIEIENNQIHVSSECASGLLQGLYVCPGFTYEGRMEILAPDTATAPSAIYIAAFNEGTYSEFLGPFAPGVINYEFTPTIPYINLVVLAINSDSTLTLPDAFEHEGGLAAYCSDSVEYYLTYHKLINGCNITFGCGPDPSVWEPWDTNQNAFENTDCHPQILPFPTDTMPVQNDCVQFLLEAAQANADYQYQQYMDSVRQAYRELYISKCMDSINEHFDRVFTDGQYHYTLYYYDRAGNLVKTVPPHAVAPLTGADLAAVNNARDNGTVKVPNHNKTGEDAFALGTRYRYNSLNQPIEQETPDGGKSTFYYDRLGRISVSQNAVQEADGKYSYTEYDDQGRIVEVGQFTQIVSPATRTMIYEPGTQAGFFTYATYREQITQTHYDSPVDPPISFAGGFSQNNLRSRVSYTLAQPMAETTFVFGTYYDYDIHGNVKALVHVNEYAPAPDLEQNLVEYDYDLVSGAVKKVGYNKHRPDRYFHRYSYDDQNRLTHAYTSRNDVRYDLDAKYFYYWHGPLARVELGQDKVQGVDYAYTIHGWLKSLNSDALRDDIDPGLDGHDDVSNSNRYFARDAYGLSLHYYSGDYLPIENSYEQTKTLPVGYNAISLFNGNISAMNNTLKKRNATFDYAVRPLLQRFGYDQLNRIASSVAFDNFDMGNNQWDASSSPLDVYATSYSYDPAGNLLTLNRNGDKTDTLEMDSLKYVYYPNTNRLMRVEDVVASTNYGMDVDNQTGANYAYDAIGNLIKDEAEEIEEITWTVYGKVSEVKRYATSTKPDLRFFYDAAGRRIMKKVIPKNCAPEKTEYYAHDAQGNILTIYSYLASEEPTYTVNGQLIYGSSRLGTWKSDLELLAHIPENPEILATDRGNKNYEMADHLGNVHTVVSDRKKRICQEGVFAYHEADIRSANDYYAFGMMMPGRDFTPAPYHHIPCDSVADSVMVTVYDIGFGSHPPSWTTEDEGMSWYLNAPGNTYAENGRLALKNIYSEGTPYVILPAPELEGGQTYYYEFDLDTGNCSALDSISLFVTQAFTSNIALAENISAGGHITGSFTADSTGNHFMGIVLFGGDTCSAYLDNFRLWYYRDTTVYSCDSSAVYNCDSTLVRSESYRFGFNGVEKENDLYGEGNAYSFEYRIYDSRIGRFLSVDPLYKDYPEVSNYAFAENRVIEAIDIEGLEAMIVFEKSTNSLYILPDISKVDLKLPIKVVSAQEYNDKDVTSNQVILIQNVFTGGHYDTETGQIVYNGSPNEVAIPNDTYDLLENRGDENPAHAGWLRLDAQDSKPYNDQYDVEGVENSAGEKRTGFRFHLGGTSWGCVTICNRAPGEDRIEEWTVIQKAIQNTTTTKVPERRGRQSLNPFSYLKNYGKLIVVDKMHSGVKKILNNGGTTNQNQDEKKSDN